MNNIPGTESLKASAETISTVSMVSLPTARIGGERRRGRAATNPAVRRHRPTMSRGAESPGLGGREGRREAGMAREGITSRVAAEHGEGKGARSPWSAAATNGNEAERRRSIEIYVAELCGFPSYFYEYFFILV